MVAFYQLSDEETRVLLISKLISLLEFYQFPFLRIYIPHSLTSYDCNHSNQKYVMSHFYFFFPLSVFQVDLFYQEDNLPDELTLMEMAANYAWKRVSFILAKLSGTWFLFFFSVCSSRNPSSSQANNPTPLSLSEFLAYFFCWSPRLEIRQGKNKVAAYKSRWGNE